MKKDKTILKLSRPFYVGRDKSSDLLFKDIKVSLKQCLINPLDKTLRITDLNSANGTFVKVDKLIPVKKDHTYDCIVMDREKEEEENGPMYSILRKIVKRLKKF